MSNPSTELGRAVVSALLGAGIREIVVAPGSRNAPLSFAAYDAAAAGLVRLHTRIDERTAGFLALGLTRSGSRAAVVCTSGSAVANLHPAVLEAAHAGLPLIVVTADRPARLRGTNANQTTDQVGLFGPAATCIDVAAPHDIPDLADPDLADPDPDPGPNLDPKPPLPIHLNIQLDEPLTPEDTWTPPRREVTDGGPRGDRWRAEGSPMAGRVVIDGDKRTVVVAGDDAGPPARTLAEHAGWPLLAEPTSGSRTGESVIRTYRLLLDTDLGHEIERVVVYGHPTLSRPVTRLLGREHVEVWSGPAPGRWSTRPFPVDHTFTRAVPAGTDPTDWAERWHAADRAAGAELDRIAREEFTPYAVAGAVSAALPPGGLLVVGASSPIRDLDLMVAKYAVGDRRKVIANRGLAGIDGTVSSAIGATLGRPSTTRALALMGDVTFLHDATALFLGPEEPRPDLTLVVVNDDGGSIFSMLEQGSEAYADRFDRLFGTPHGTDLAALCAASRTPHLKVTSLPELDQALASPNGGIEVVEAVVRRDNRRELDARIRALGGQVSQARQA